MNHVSNTSSNEEQHNVPSTSSEPAVLRADTLASYIDERVEEEAERRVEKKVEQLEKRFEEEFERRLHEALSSRLDALRKAKAPTPLWSVKDVADYLGVSDRQVRFYLSDGQLTSTKIGKQHRFEPKAVQRAARSGLSPQSQ